MLAVDLSRMLAVDLTLWRNQSLLTMMMKMMITVMMHMLMIAISRMILCSLLMKTETVVEVGPALDHVPDPPEDVRDPPEDVHGHILNLLRGTLFLDLGSDIPDLLGGTVAHILGVEAVLEVGLEIGAPGVEVDHEEDEGISVLEVTHVIITLKSIHVLVLVLLLQNKGK